MPGFYGRLLKKTRGLYLFHWKEWRNGKKATNLFCNENFYPLVGGAQTQTLAQCKCLLEKGYEATVVTYCYDKNWLRREVLDGLPIIRVAATFMGNRAATLWPARQPSSSGKGFKKLPDFFASCLLCWP